MFKKLKELSKDPHVRQTAKQLTINVAGIVILVTAAEVTKRGVNALVNKMFESTIEDANLAG